MKLVSIFLGFSSDQLKSVDISKVRGISMQDFKESLKKVRPSVSPSALRAYENWNKSFGDVST